MAYCIYYQALIEQKRCWLFTAILRSYEHLAFDRTIDVATGRLEFFVSPELESYFLQVMAYFQQIGIVSQLQRLPNRLQEESSSL